MLRVFFFFFFIFYNVCTDHLHRALSNVKNILKQISQSDNGIIATPLTGQLKGADSSTRVTAYAHTCLKHNILHLSLLKICIYLKILIVIIIKSRLFSFASLFVSAALHRDHSRAKAAEQPPDGSHQGFTAAGRAVPIADGRGD